MELAVEPAVLEAVSVYVAVADGVTVVDPVAATAPMPGVRLTLVAFDVDQENVTDWPLVTMVWLAVKELMTGAEPLTVNVTPTPALDGFAPGAEIVTVSVYVPAASPAVSG
jgi:hypothetical protein